MSSKVFISYRRDDSKYQARDVYRALSAVLPHGHVFMDVDSIPPGANFKKILEGWVEQCDILLALIGPEWIGAIDTMTGLRRLDNPSDFVRIEIAKALARDIPVVPIVLDRAPMPRADELPENLKELVDRHAEFLEYRTFDTDVQRLIQKLGLVTRGTQATAPPPAAPRGLSSGDVFRDIDIGPEMVVVPAGEFVMGSNDADDEKPPHKVTIAKPFAVGRYPITFDEWDAALAAGGVEHKPETSWGRVRQPVMNVSWEDAKAYAAWLSQKSGKVYRLLSEAEWEYCCRAGTKGKYAFGESIAKQQAQFSEGEYGSAGSTVDVGLFQPNAFGLYDMHGNVWEWCEDTWHPNYQGAPTNGSVWQGGDPSSRVLRGGSWNYPPDYLRSAYRFRPSRRPHQQCRIPSCQIALTSFPLTSLPPGYGGEHKRRFCRSAGGGPHFFLVHELTLTMDAAVDIDNLKTGGLKILRLQAAPSHLPEACPGA